MRFLKEDNNLNIEIAKFRKSDLVLNNSRFAIIIGKYKPDGTRLPTLQNKKLFIPAAQVAEDKEYVLIPTDQLTQMKDKSYKFPEIIKLKTISKYNWLEIKRNFPFKGAK